MIVFGLLAWTESSPARRDGTSWSLLVCARAENEDYILFQTRQKWTVSFTVKRSYPNWSKSASPLCHSVSYPSGTEHLLTPSHGKAGSKLDCRQLQWLQRKRRMATELTWPQQFLLPCLESYAWMLNTNDELEKVLQSIWDDLPQNFINKAILSFVKRLRACVKAAGGYFEHVLRRTVFGEFWIGSKRR